MPDTFVGHNLTCHRARRIVFADLNFHLTNGQTLRLSGRNGSGKTSLLRMMAGWLSPSRGTLTWRDDRIEHELHSLRIGWLGISSGLGRRQFTVGEIVNFWHSWLNPGDDRRRVGPALERVGLSALAATPTRWLSAGQRHRLALAVLWISQRPLWLLDEPTSTLDVDGVRLLNELMREHCQQDGITVYAHHNHNDNTSEGLPVDVNLSLDDYQRH